MLGTEIGDGMTNAFDRLNTCADVEWKEADRLTDLHAERGRTKGSKIRTGWLNTDPTWEGLRSCLEWSVSSGKYAKYQYLHLLH